MEEQQRRQQEYLTITSDIRELQRKVDALERQFDRASTQQASATKSAASRHEHQLKLASSRLDLLEIRVVGAIDRASWRQPAIGDGWFLGLAAAVWVFVLLVMIATRSA